MEKKVKTSALHLVEPAPSGVAPAFLKLQPRTLVHQVIDALVAGASEGLILPGTHLDFQHLSKTYDAAHPRAKKN